MADRPTTSVPFVTEHQQLHERLLAGDPVATKELAEAFLDRLIGWLAQHNPLAPPDVISEAAEDALLNLFRNPGSYRPVIPLESYLRMSARGDLLNALSRHKRDAENLRGAVELALHSGNSQGRKDDPLSQLEAAEEEAARGIVPASVLRGLTEGEVRVLNLMLAGERRTREFAEALGIVPLPAGEQRQRVKQVKDRLKKRLQRAGGEDE